MDDGFPILSSLNLLYLSSYVEKPMTKLLLILMVVGVMVGVVGCGKDSPTGEETTELLVWTTTYDDGDVKEEYQYYNHPENNTW